MQAELLLSATGACSRRKVSSKARGIGQELDVR